MPRRSHRRQRLLLLPVCLVLLVAALLYFRCGRGRGPAPPPPRQTIAAPITAQRDPALAPLRVREEDEGPNAVVLGFLPHWVDREHIRHDLLTDIACFAIEFHPDGSIKDAHGWPWLDAINEAHAAGVRTHITAQLFGAGDLKVFLTNPQARRRFHHAIGTAAVVAGAAGIVIDFEGTTNNGWADHMPIFAAELRAYLEAEAPGLRLSFAVPAVNWGEHWDFRALAKSSDHLIIMGYDYAGSWSERAGPSAPLIGRPQNVTATVREEYAAVGGGGSEKLILALPHYGNHWLVDSGEAGAKATRWVEFLTYSAMQRLLAEHESRWDASSQTPWVRWRDRQGWHQVWYEDARSFRLKAQLAKKEGLGGIGLWALGFSGSHPELWREIEGLFIDGLVCIGDLNGDNRVDGEDLHRLIEAYGETAAGDLNADGVTDQTDLLLLLDNYPSRCDD
ncbi:MAG: glycosyl hydrolase family 18 protein [Phycisphaerales bacterium JB038]